MTYSLTNICTKNFGIRVVSFFETQCRILAGAQKQGSSAQFYVHDALFLQTNLDTGEGPDSTCSNFFL